VAEKPRPASDPALWLAQVQSFLSLGFLLVFAALSLGLVWMLAWFRLRSVGAQADPGWLAAYRFWVRVFALAASLAAGSGAAALVLLPGLWPGLAERIADILSPLLALAMVGALVSGACCVGPMLFGERRLRPRWHAAAVVLVAVGLSVTVACVLALASWTRNPTGVLQQNGRFVVLDWGQVLANPGLPWIGGLMLAGSCLCAALLVLAVTAWQVRARPSGAGERLALRAALVVALASVLALLFLCWGVGGGVHEPSAAAPVWLPFAVQNAISLDEVVTDASATALACVLVLSALVYLALCVAFIAIVRHAARYGVVPVGRKRGYAR